MSLDSAFPLEASIAAPLFDLGVPGYHSFVAGYSHIRHVQCTDVNKLLYEKIFKIFDNFGLKYYVFAGALVGYVRDGKLPPWIDDMDVMIFREHIEFFESTVVPALSACGFNCRPVAKQFSGGGYHILGLQNGKRDKDITFTDSTSINVPWLQVDVFYSEHCDGLVKNLAGWGLYHNKKVKSEWVGDGKSISMNGIMFPTFMNINDDVLEEYGDVLNNVVVKTHGKSFLSASNLPYQVFANAYSKTVNLTSTTLPPGVSRHDLSMYSGLSQKAVDIDPKLSFEEIVRLVVFKDTSSITLNSSDHLFWAADLKRLFPGLSVVVSIQTFQDAHNSALLCDFIDDVVSSKKNLVSLYKDHVSSMKRHSS